MTEDEKRLALVTGSCPECGHGILNHHRNGRCVVCGCPAIQPPNSQGQQTTIDDLYPDITSRLKGTGRVIITSSPLGQAHGWIKKAFL